MNGDTRRQAHELIDQLPEAQLSGFVRFLQTILEPVSYRLANAPIDDESFTEGERQAVAEAVEWLKHNEPIPHEQVLAEFGLTMADWKKMAEGPSPGEPRPGPMAKRIVWTDQAKADVRAIEQKTALQILKTLARFAKTEEGNIHQFAGVEPPEFCLRAQDHRVFFRVRGDAIEILRARSQRHLPLRLSGIAVIADVSASAASAQGESNLAARCFRDVDTTL